MTPEELLEIALEAKDDIDNSEHYREEASEAQEHDRNRDYEERLFGDNQ